MCWKCTIRIWDIGEFELSFVDWVNVNFIINIINIVENCGINRCGLKIYFKSMNKRLIEINFKHRY